MEMRSAGSVMIPLERFAYIPYWFTLRQAMAEMHRSAGERSPDSGLPWMILVFSAQNQLLGMVRREEIMRGLMPEMAANQSGQYRTKLFDVNVDADLYKMSFCQDKVMAAYRKHIERPVSEFMLPVKATVDHAESILLAIYQMIDQNLQFIPVVKEQQVVGIIDAIDALEEVSRVLLACEPE